ncbi:hypothetical protein PHYSODRAFT_321238 [Phytophthora sojae]|uniref:Uncharacterized protein n=1 Tax=Phytophthora sojae (strain P6497) TaxID=1094619 RepID=G4YGU6_PHYSP|nr:hypothetical protein PHYSODRAFT_321238 [Phytophthora sojae]EGZ27427.1 hypothetical protein PHYSODRAFT_321238 [Phytophthora sojae]|eukprot:XP_009514702.1 hypothetical protein PHYSODRAFT_321238 [Phytophthora sojae]
MAGRKEAREGGRGGGRGEASRQSRRGQGLPPEELKALDDVVREARKAGAEKRKAALEEKKKASAADQDQAAPESSVLDAHQANQDEAPEADSTESVPAGTECVPDPVTGLDEGADEVEPPAEDRVSDSPQPDDEVEILDEAPTIKHEGPLSTVEEDGVLNDEADTRSAPAQSSLAVTAQAPALKMEAQSRPSETKAQVSEAQAKAYAEQVRRWEQHRERAAVQLKVEYAWPEPAPDFTEWWTAALLATLTERLFGGQRRGDCGQDVRDVGAMRDGGAYCGKQQELQQDVRDVGAVLDDFSGRVNDKRRMPAADVYCDTHFMVKSMHRCDVKRLAFLLKLLIIPDAIV